MSTLLASDWVVLVPDWLDCVSFLEFAVFARDGMLFESHLGHSVTPRQRSFCFKCVYLDPPQVPLTLAAVCACRCGYL